MNGKRCAIEDGDSWIMYYAGFKWAREIPIQEKQLLRITAAHVKKAKIVIVVDNVDGKYPSTPDYCNFLDGCDNVLFVKLQDLINVMQAAILLRGVDCDQATKKKIMDMFTLIQDRRKLTLYPAAEDAEVVKDKYQLMFLYGMIHVKNIFFCDMDVVVVNEEIMSLKPGQYRGLFDLSIEPVQYGTKTYACYISSKLCVGGVMLNNETASPEIEYMRAEIAKNLQMTDEARFLAYCDPKLCDISIYFGLPCSACYLSYDLIGECVNYDSFDVNADKKKYSIIDDTLFQEALKFISEPANMPLCKDCNTNYGTICEYQKRLEYLARHQMRQGEDVIFQNVIMSNTEDNNEQTRGKLVLRAVESSEVYKQAKIQQGLGCQLSDSQQVIIEAHEIIKASLAGSQQELSIASENQSPSSTFTVEGNNKLTRSTYLCQ